MENRLDNTGDKLESTPDANFLDLLIAFGQNLRLLIIIPIMMGGVSLFVTNYITPLFTAQTVFLPPADESKSNPAAAQLGNLAGLPVLGPQSNNIEQVVSFLKSNTLLDAVIEGNDLKTYYKLTFDQDLRGALLADTQIKVGTDGLISLRFTARDPNLAADIANDYVTELKSLSSRLVFTEAQRRKKFYEEKFEDTQKSLTNALTKLKSSGLDKTISRVYPETAIEGIQEIQQRLSVKEIEINRLETYLAEDSAQLLTHKSELSALRKQLNQLLGTAESTTDLDTDYVKLYRQYKTQEQLYKLYFQELERANLDVSREGGFIQVIDPAYPPQLRSHPKRKQIAIYTSLVTGFAVLFFIIIKFVFRINRNQDDDVDAKLGTLKRAIANQFFLR